MILDNFCCIGAELQNREVSQYKAPQLFYYRSANSSETLEVMLTAGFFNEIYQRVNIGDLILVYEPMDKKLQYIKITSNIGGVVGFEKIASSAITAEEVPVEPKEPFTSNNLQALSEEIIDKLAEMQDDIDGKLTAEDAHLTGTTTAENIIVSGDMTAEDITGEKLVINTEATIEGANLTGDSTIEDTTITNATITDLVVSNSISIPEPSTDTNAATKKYVDEHTPTGTYHPDLFVFENSDYKRNDIQWLRTDNFSWHNGMVVNEDEELEEGLYYGVYQHLVNDIDGVTPEYDEIGDLIIEFYRAEDGHKIVLDTELENIVNLYNKTGVAWYYLLDTTNHRFKLPRTKYRFSGYKDGLGNYIHGSLPNIYGTTGLNVGNSPNNVTVSGAFGKDGPALPTMPGESYTTKNTIYLDANKVDPAYQSNAPVLPRGTQAYLYCYVGNYTQEAIEQTAGLNQELFNDKADVDLENISDSAKSKIENCNLPDYSNGITLSVSSGNTYTVPQNGYLSVIIGYSGSNAVRILNNNSSGNILMYIWTQNNNATTGYLPVLKNQTLYFNEITGSSIQITFYPSLGV